MMLRFLIFKLKQVLDDIRGEFEYITEDLLDLFAKSLVPQIREFYSSEEGNEYFRKWLEKHPEYKEKESAHSTKNADKCILTPKEAV